MPALSLYSVSRNNTDYLTIINSYVGFCKWGDEKVVAIQEVNSDTNAYPNDCTALNAYRMQLTRYATIIQLKSIGHLR